MSIVFYESDKSDHDLILKMLRDAGYVDVVSITALADIDGTLGLGRSLSLGSASVDLVIFDVTNERDSIEYCRRIKDSPIYSDVPLIILSAQAEPETLQMAFAYGANDFIPKPIRSYEFMARVRAALIYKHEGDRRKAREKELLEVTRQLSDLNSRLNRLSLVDGLTGISNRRFFDQSLSQEWRLSQRNEKPISIIFGDVDHFKLYNDSYGHQAGDEVLSAVAQCMHGCLRRPTDLLARYGGEEFAAILPDTDITGAIFVAERINTTVQGINIPHGHSPTSDRVTISIGVSACIPDTSLEYTDLIEAADRALYQAKDEGRKCVRSLEPTPAKKLPKAK